MSKDMLYEKSIVLLSCWVIPCRPKRLAVFAFFAEKKIEKIKNDKTMSDGLPDGYPHS